MSETDLFADHKADLADEWHDTFDALTAQGKSPTGIKATIEYVTTPKTQSEVSSEFDTSEVTIRSMQAAVIALGPVDAKRAATHSSDRQTSMDYCNHIGDRLGWESGVEYTVSQSGDSTSSQPRMLKEGWRSLYKAIVEGSEGDE